MIVPAAAPEGQTESARTGWCGRPAGPCAAGKWLSGRALGD